MPSWVTGPSLTNSRWFFGLAALGGKLYAVGGETGGIEGDAKSVEVLDTTVATPAWVAGPSLSSPRVSLGLAALGAKLYAVGGMPSDRATSSVEVLDTTAATPAWVAGPSLVTARSNFGLATLGGKLYAAGGVNSWPAQAIASVEVLDTTAATPAWVAAPSLSAPRADFGLAAMGGKLYAVGGTDAGWRLPSVEILDLSTASSAWVAGPALGQTRSSFGLAAIDDTLHAVGGYDWDTGGAFSSSESLPVFSTCNATAPTQPATPDASGFAPLQLYRMQGATWVANLSNADAASVGGLSCFIETNAAAWLPKYGEHPVVARYRVLAVSPDARPVGKSTGYADCTEVPPRTCSAARGNPFRVGVEPTTTTGCTYSGSWYSLPAGGECRAGCARGPGGGACLGFSCYWQVTAIEKIVGWECLKSHSCNATSGGCPPATLQAAFDACPDLCTPPVPSDGCGGAGRAMISNELDRFGFDPAQCAACLRKGAPWYTTIKAPTQWTCGHPDPQRVTSSVIFFDTGEVSNASDACHCHYTDLQPPPPVPCPHGSYSACVVACSELPPPKQSPCIAVCKRLCPH